MFEIKQHVAGKAEVYDYVVITTSALGLLAVSHLGVNLYCVHVRPANADCRNALNSVLERNIFVDPSWHDLEANGQQHFAASVEGHSNLHKALEMALQALYPGTVSHDDMVEAALAAIALVGTTSREYLTRRLRDAKTPGINSAARWTTTTLFEKALHLRTPAGEHAALAAEVKKKRLPGYNLATTWPLDVLRRKVIFSH